MTGTPWRLAEIAGAIAALGIAVFLADRVLLAMEARGWIYWRKRKGLSSIGADFVTEGSPGAQAVKRAMEQERVRKNVRPAEDPPFQVDLDSGTVRIRRRGGGPKAPRREDQTGPEGSSGAAESGGAGAVAEARRPAP